MKKVIILLAILFVQPLYAKNEITNSMNEVYQEMIKDHKTDIQYIEKVKKVKKKWNEFLNAQVELMYPFDSLGTLQYSCRQHYKDNLDRAIMNETKYLFYVEKGSPCNVCQDD